MRPTIFLHKCTSHPSDLVGIYGRALRKQQIKLISQTALSPGSCLSACSAVS